MLCFGEFLLYVMTADQESQRVSEKICTLQAKNSLGPLMLFEFYLKGPSEFFAFSHNRFFGHPVKLFGHFLSCKMFCF
jgi:hypothetical protein